MRSGARGHEGWLHEWPSDVGWLHEWDFRMGWWVHEWDFRAGQGSKMGASFVAMWRASGRAGEDAS